MRILSPLSAAARLVLTALSCNHLPMNLSLQNISKRISYVVLLGAAFVLTLFTGTGSDHSLRGMFTPQVPTAHADVSVGCSDNAGGDGVGSTGGDCVGCTDGDCGTGGGDCGGGCGGDGGSGG